MTSKVFVVFKTHLDIGFTDSAKNVVARYIHDFIPAALKIARESRHKPDRFIWTTGSWLAYRFLEEATTAQRRAMEDAIAAGDFYWHALPFTMHSELVTPSLFEAGIAFSQRLDARFGKKTIAAKMTDVPGHTCGIVPLLCKAGVKLLHIGVNPASTVPDVPLIFRWKTGESEIVVVYDKTYGATNLLPGGLALSVNLTNDNLGPPCENDIHETFERLRRQFPGATITPSSLNQAAEHLWSRRQELPIFTEEIGDTWIHGIGTAPLKVARFRELSRLREKWISNGKLQEGNSVDQALTERLLLVAEHTWGMDIKTHLNDWSAYTARQLQRSLGKPNFRKVAASWSEQERYLTSAVSNLSLALRKEAQSCLNALRPRLHRNIRGSKNNAGDIIQLGEFQLKLDGHGAIYWLKQDGNPSLLADGRHRLSALSYQTFSERDYRRFYRQYNTLDVPWAQMDFTKPGLPACARTQSSRPILQSIITQKNRAIATLEFARSLQLEGAPSGISLEIVATPEGLDLRLQWTRKIPTRLPESVWLGFNPTPQARSDWRLNKLGMDISPLAVCSKGNRSLHGVTGAAHTEKFYVISPDSVLVCPGKPRLLNFDDKQPDLRSGIAYNLFNNVWGTNFPMWNAAAATFRFSLRWPRSG